MTRIGIISDTHGGYLDIKCCIAKAEDVDMWFHLGDLVSDAEALARLTGKPVHAVRGNCDGFCSYEVELIVPVEKARLLLVHGHRHGIDRLTNMNACYRAEELNCDALFYGHTHISEISAWGKILVVNPGSPHHPRGGRKPSFAIATVDGSDVRAKIITI